MLSERSMFYKNILERQQGMGCGSGLWRRFRRRAILSHQWSEERLHPESDTGVDLEGYGQSGQVRESPGERQIGTRIMNGRS